MKRTDIIQTLIKKNNAKKYLEIGLGDGENFANIMCDYKITQNETMVSINLKSIVSTSTNRINSYTRR